MADVKVNLTYPVNDHYTYETSLERLDLDQERLIDISTGNGFPITAPKPIKEDVKDPNGIFSQRFGRGLDDLHPYSDRYKCDCGFLTFAFNNGQECPKCHTKVKYVGDNFSYFGWIILKDPYHMIHPTLFMSLSSFFGPEVFNNMIKIQTKKDEDGNDIEIKRPKKEPFFGIGMEEFYNRFDEIMEYYRQRNKTPQKQERYEDIMKDRNKVFTQSFPVFTTLLRPFKVEAGELHFEGTNAHYKIMASIAARINSDKLNVNKNSKNKNELLYDLQMKIKELFNEINKILSTKKGSIRQLLGGRFNFTARSVISPSSRLKIDEVGLSYQCLVGLLQQRIINILHKAYNMQYNEAYVFLDSNRRTENPIIKEIIMSIIRSEKRGLPVLINRNPTIMYGGILQMYCTNICSGFCMQLPLQVLKGLAADFDGDTLNIMLIINRDFEDAARHAFNPADALIISKNDGMFAPEYNHQRDCIINANTMIYLSRDYYSKSELDRIKRITGAKI